MSSPQLHFEKLTPIDNAEIGVYSQALDFVFENKDIKNIAITGQYGAGKSSVLESYKKNKAGKKLSFIHISLAHFEAATGKKIKDSKMGEAVFEGKILNQLLHQIPPDKIPLSHFKIKTDVSFFKTLKVTAAIMLVIWLAMYFWNFESWCHWIENGCLEYGLSGNWSALICCFVPTANIFLVGCMIYALAYIQRSKFFFRKIALYGNEIEIGGENTESFIDKYLNEVLYLFENAGADAIVFEDMDRFNYTRIFEKLREINYLVNAKKTKGVVRFFYLLRDDIFISKDRTKFFDFIIPVVPVVDGSNSYDQFIDHFKSARIFEDFKAEFLQGISLYIDDMRVLKNICTEYLIYYHRIQSTELDRNKLLAIIVYKNLFPKDFSDSQLNRGFVYSLFALKEILIPKSIDEFYARISHNNELIAATENDHCINIDELDTIFIKPIPDHRSVGGTQIENFEANIDLVRALKEPNASISNALHYQYQHPIFYDIQAAISALTKNQEYVRRRDALDRRNNDEINRIQSENQELIKQISLLKEAKLQKLLSRDNIDTYFDSLETKNSLDEVEEYKSVKGSFYFPLLKYLVRNGYIDESYQDYMTYFYENSITRSDKIFLRSITDEKSKEFSYELKNIDLIIKNLTLSSFDQQETLNFDLFRFLLQNKDKYSDYLIRLITQLEKKQCLDFIAQFFNRCPDNRPLLVESLNHHWARAWSLILKSSVFTDHMRHQYAVATLYESPDEDVKRMNDESGLTDYISQNPGFLRIKNPDIEVIIQKLILMNVRFEKINYEEADKQLFLEVYRNDLYLLNDNMVSLILNKVYEIPETEDYLHRNYSLIRSEADEHLLKYINKNFPEYFDLMLGWCQEKITDDEETALVVLNNESIDNEKKIQYIQFLQTELENLNDVEDVDLWQDILTCQIVNYSTSNILEYFFNSGSGLDETLVAFINGGSKSICFSYDAIENNHGEKSAGKFYSAIMQCVTLDNQKYKKILNEIDMRYSQFIFPDIPSNKIAIIIELGAIIMNNDNVLFMRQNYSNNLKYFILSKSSEYVNAIIENPSIFNLEELINLLQEEKMNDDEKIKLLQLTQQPISIADLNLTDAIKLHILTSNIFVDDLSILVRNYQAESQAVQTEIFRLCTVHISLLITRKYVITFELLSLLLTNNDVITDNKLQLLINSLPELDAEQAKICFTRLEMQDFVGLFENKTQPKIENTPHYVQLLDIMEEKEWISSKKLVDEDKYYRVYPKNKILE